MVLRQFAEWAVRARGAGLERQVEKAATRAVLDWYAATIAGSGSPPARILAAALLPGDSGNARLVPAGTAASARTAALINGAASHTAEMDDIYRDGIYHPGSPTVAAALATAESLRAGGRDLLRSVAVGYEIGCRVAAAIQPAHYTYWHTTGTVGTLGAAAASADLYRLDAEQFAHALATATTMAAGLQQAFRSEAMSKPLHAGHAAEAGMLAAIAASKGFTGALDVLDGPAGFGAAMSSEPDWQAAIAVLGTDWCVTRPTVKRHSCCGHTFAAVDAALQLRQEGVAADAVRSITVATYGTALKVAGNPNPQTSFEAKFSTAYCVAAALEFGSARLEAFDEDRIFHPRLRRLVGSTSLEVEPSYEAAFPGRRAARVTLTLQDGSVREAVRLTRKGDPDDPLTDAELSEKFADLVAPVLGAAGAGRLQEALWGLADMGDVGQLHDTYGTH